MSPSAESEWTASLPRAAGIGAGRATGKAKSTGIFVILRQAIERKLDLFQIDGWTPLHTAAYTNKPKRVRALLYSAEGQYPG